MVHRGRVLLVQRANPPLQGQWNLPGGVVELGESLREAVVREVMEETGLDVAVGAVVEVLERVHRAADGRVEFHYVIVDFLCRPSTAHAVEGSDAAAVRWAEPGDLPALGVTDTAIAVIHKALELLQAEA